MDKFSSVLLHMRSEGFRPEKYKVLTTFPRENISFHRETSLESLNLCPQVTSVADIAVVLHGVQSDDGPTSATEHLTHASLLPLAATRCQAHGPSCHSFKFGQDPVTDVRYIQ